MMTARRDVRPGADDGAGKPALLLKRDAETGRWAWKRTGKGPWIGWFETPAEACRDAERLGLMPGSYRIELIEDEG